MKQFSAQYIITNSGNPLKRGIITTDDDGIILDIEDTKGSLTERRSVEFYNGIIVPGFVNCHSHLELSHLKGSAMKGLGLGDFIQQVRTTRESSYEAITESSEKADKELGREGVVLCADICNNDTTAEVKLKSSISYINLLEVFGIDPAKAEKRLYEISRTAEKFDNLRLPYYFVPHAVYSTSAPLFRLVKEKSSENKVTSIHFMETEGEIEFIRYHKGMIAQSYLKSGLMPDKPLTVRSHEDAVLNEITQAGNLILVHNTFAARSTVDIVNSRKNTYWCICPGSNLYIENKLPDIKMLHEAGCEIVIGTDSLASNDRLSLLGELKIIQENFPEFSLAELIKWATINGARALKENQTYGSIEPGKRPGLLLIRDMDLKNLRLLPGTTVSRLI